MTTVSNELALGNVLSSILADAELCDVTLKGADGVMVPACKPILSARSKVFRQMLFGKFNEASSPVVPLGYSGEILKAVVEYIHTDMPEILKRRKRKHDESIGNGNDETFFGKLPAIISLASAAVYFDLPGLSKEVEEFVSFIIGEIPSWCFHFLELCRNGGPEVPEKLGDFALSTVRSNGRGCINSTTVEGLSAAVLEEILQDEKIQMAEEDLFKILQLWTETNPSERLSTAKKLVGRHISLEKVDPRLLMSEVTSSNLVSTEQLSEAYKKQALLAHPTIFKQLRHSERPIWKISNSETTGCTTEDPKFETDVLLCAPMTSGVHQWKTKLVKKFSQFSVRFGIVPAGIQRDSALRLGKGEADWAITEHGYIYHACEEYKDRLDIVYTEDGDTAILTLDLRPDQAGNGTLTWGVEGKGEAQQAFANLRNYLDQYPQGFVPAVSTPRSASACLVSIEKLQD